MIINQKLYKSFSFHIFAHTFILKQILDIVIQIEQTILILD